MRTLIVVDMQNDFIDGALGTKEAQAIVPNVKKKIREYQEHGDKIIFTRDTHSEDYLNTPEGRKLPVKHCIEGTHGWQIAEGLEVPGCSYLNKPTFGWIHWDGMLLGDVELVGLCTDICVVSNALILKAVFPEAEITVDASCCAGVTPETHRAALETMKMCQVQVIHESGVNGPGADKNVIDETGDITL
ncbi:MAG: isochorismatase family cysteine hydrolase [Lachnospiraceae bacterium]|nr:isochorismatase family cysteine hydrolase [Lachnospiraceae bacterium]